jgi:tetratricopeptide (TPR) repeat protein
MTLAAVCAVLAASSKEQGFMLALLVPVVAPPVSGKRLVQMVVVGGALGLAFVARWGVMRGVLLQPGLVVFENLSFAERLAQGSRLFFEYLRLTVWPHPLLFEYDIRALRPDGGFRDFRVLAGAAAFVAFLAATCRMRSRPVLASGAALFLLPLVPVLNVVAPIGEDFAERFLALPIAGAAILVGGIAARFKAVGFGAGMLLVAACGALFTLRAADYKSERVLYDSMLARAPDSPAARSLVASSLLLPEGGTKRPELREAARALALLREAVALDPTYAPARVILATAESERRAAQRIPPLPAEVEFLYESARLLPAMPRVHGMLGVALYERNAPDLAQAAFEKELAIMPLDLTAASYLSRIYESQKDPRAQTVMADVRRRWEALWRRFPGFAPVAIAYSHTLSDRAFDLDGARTVLREAAKSACRSSDQRAIEAALAEIGGR